MGLLKDVGSLLTKQGSYMRGHEAAINGQPRFAGKISNKEEYDKGYSDGLQEKLIAATNQSRQIDEGSGRW